MAVYRPKRRISPITLGAIVALIVIALLLVLFFATRKAAAPGDPLQELHNRALDAANGLDVFEVEYPKTTSSGAGPALARAKSAFAGLKDDLTKVDSAAATQITADFAALDDKINAKAPTDDVVALADKIKTELLDIGRSKQ